jgi:transcriptional regulator with GAF, ATPase, and Fis domain/serine/threonine protein kinase
VRPGETISSRYRIESLIGSGGSAEVFRVIDLTSQQPRALKLFRPRAGSDDAIRRAFHREFELLTQLRHRHLVAIEDCGVEQGADGRRPWFTMELIAGRPLDQVFGVTRDWRLMSRAVDAVLDALSLLHDRGLVHGDVTCNNVLCGAALDAEPPPVWLMDFGLTDLAGRRTDGVLAGSVATMAPESLTGGASDRRSDLYSLGCVLYRLTTGQDPFTGHSPWEILRAHARTPPVPPRQLNPDLPVSLESLILALLAKSPASRPASAHDVRRLLSPFSGRTLADSRSLSRPLAPVLSGRERELALFQELLSELSHGRGNCLLISGASGSGRTRLLQEYRVASRLAGSKTVLVDAPLTARSPFGLIDACLAGWIAESPVEARALEAVPHRLDRIAMLLESQPTVLLIDDALAADSASIELLHQVVQRRFEAGWPLLVVMAIDPSDANAQPWFDEWLERGQARVLRLRPLEPAALERMMASMLGRDTLPSRWNVWFAEHSGGVPLIAHGLAVGLFDSKLLERDPELESPPVDDSEIVRRTALRSANWWTETWEKLSETERALLGALAITDGEPITFDQLGELDPQSIRDQAAVEALQQRSLVRRTETARGEPGLSLSSPTLAALIKPHVPAAQTTTLHARRAEQLRTVAGHELACARHLIEARTSDQAVVLLVRAAKVALSQRIPREALRLAEIGLRHAVQPGSEHAALLGVKAQALAHQGLAQEAERSFADAIAAARAARAPEELATTLLAAGSFRGERSDASGGLSALEESLAISDELGDVAAGARVLIEMGRLLCQQGRLEDAEARLASARSQAQRAHDVEIEAAALVAWAELDSNAGRPERASESYRRAEELLVGNEPSLTKSLARRGKATALAATGRWSEALEQLDLWAEESRRFAQRENEAEALSLSALVLETLGKRREALRRIEQAQSIQRMLGRVAQLATLAARASRLLLERGQPRAGWSQLDEAQQLIERIGSTSARRVLASARARLDAHFGRYEEAPARPGGEPEATPETDQQSAERSLLRGMARLRAGDPASARADLQEACFVARRVGQSAIGSEGLLLLAESYLELRDFERAQLALRRVRQQVSGPTNEEWSALGRVLQAEWELRRPDGDLAAGREEIEAAIEVLLARERGDWLWRAYAILAELAEGLGLADLAQSSRAQAGTWLEAWLAAVPERDRSAQRALRRVAALLSRLPLDAGGLPAASRPAIDDSALQKLLEINKALNSTLDLKSQLQILLDTAIEISGAERGFVLLDEGDRAAIEVARGVGGADLAGSDREFSRALARQVMLAEGPLISLDVQGDERLSTSVSVHALRIQAVLATPLRVRGGVAGALVLDSRQAGAAFDNTDLELVARLGDQAGIALSNARMVEELRRQAEEIQRLNTRLSEQVEEQRVEILEKQSNLELRYRFESLIGASAPMQKVYRALDKILPTELPVLVTGESGTGKDLVARVLHYNGPRAAQRFVTLNCAALTDTLLESELFGHRKGSFTGADRDRKGLFEQADGGTLFLDEIGEMPMTLQPKLLRAIQFGEIRRVGEDTPRHVNVRIVAATHRDVAEQVRLGRFREDLMYRLDVAQIHLAPLRDRLEDLGLLIDHFLDLFAARSDKPRLQIEPAALRLFVRHQWPGNVRELENELIKLAAFAESSFITEVDVLENASFLDRAKQRDPVPEIATLEAGEIDQIRQALRAAAGNRSRAAELLGIDRSTLYRKLKRISETEDFS